MEKGGCSFIWLPCHGPFLIPELPTEQKQVIDLQHLILHLLGLSHICRGCYHGKKIKSQSRRRKTSGITVHSQDASDSPFGACVHLDFLIMQHTSRASACMCWKQKLRQPTVRGTYRRRVSPGRAKGRARKTVANRLKDKQRKEEEEVGKKRRRNPEEC